MLDNRNSTSSCNNDSRGTVCIDTKRVLDSCRDRDCFENVRVYLTDSGEQILSCSTSVRTRSAEVLWAHVGVDAVPFNCGFYRVSVRYYILIELEACQGVGRGQTFKGLSVLEKEVILFGGEGNAKTFSSTPGDSFCTIPDVLNFDTNAPVGIVETVDPIVLGTKIVDCSCPCPCNEYIDLPEAISCQFDGDLRISTDNSRLYISIGIFSVIRIVRPAQLLVQATDYSVPDKECVEASNEEDPCSVFRNMAFPSSSFSGVNTYNNGQNNEKGRSNGRGGCGCSK